MELLNNDEAFEACVSKYFEATFSFSRSDTTSDSSSGLDYGIESMDEWREISRRLDDSSSEKSPQTEMARKVPMTDPPANKSKALVKVACQICYRVFKSKQTLKCHLKEHEGVYFCSKLYLTFKILKFQSRGPEKNDDWKRERRPSTALNPSLMPMRNLFRKDQAICNS